MSPIQVTIVDNKGFWETFSSTPFWQIILILLTALLTNYFAHLFMRKRNDRRKRLEALSDFKRFGYELQQIVSNRLQCEIFHNFYEAAYRLSKDGDFLDHQKIEVARMPELSLECSKAYGRLHKTVSLLEHLTGKRKWNSVEMELDDLMEYQLPTIAPVSDATIYEELPKYRDHSTKQLALWIDENIKQNVKKVYSGLK